MTTTDDLANTVNWGIGTGMTLGVAGMTMKSMRGLYSPRRRSYRKRRKR